jgi:hypothetical protein
LHREERKKVEDRIIVDPNLFIPLVVLGKSNTFSSNTAHGRPLYVYLGNVIDYDDVPTLYMYILTPDCEIYLTDAENFEEL